MVRVSGPLVNVTTSASSVRDVQVHTKKVRAWGDGLMTPDPSQATLSNGVVEFEAAPGPVVMVLFMAEAGAETVSLVVGEGATQSLADAYRDGQMASDRDASELAGILEQIRASIGEAAEARAGAEAAAEDAAGSAVSAGRDADRAETAASTAEQDADDARRAAADTAEWRDESAGSATAAATHEQAAEAHAQTASTASTEALEAADRIGTAEQVGVWHDEALDARDDTYGARDEAEAAAVDAAGSAVSAGRDADRAEGAETRAGEHEDLARGHEDEARVQAEASSGHADLAEAGQELSEDAAAVAVAAAVGAAEASSDKADTTYVDAQDTALGKRIDDEIPAAVAGGKRATVLPDGADIKTLNPGAYITRSGASSQSIIGAPTGVTQPATIQIDFTPTDRVAKSIIWTEWGSGGPLVWVATMSYSTLSPWVRLDRLGADGGTAHLNDLIVPGNYYFVTDGQTSLDRGFPVAKGGLLSVDRWRGSSHQLVQVYFPFRYEGFFVRFFYSGQPYEGGVGGGWMEFPTKKTITADIQAALTSAKQHADQVGEQVAAEIRAELPPARSSTAAVACLGDSLTAGYSSGAAWAEGDAWPSHLATALGVGVTRLGFSGATTDVINIRSGVTPITFTVTGGVIPGARYSDVPLSTGQRIGSWGDSGESFNSYGWLAGRYGLLKFDGTSYTFTTSDVGEDQTLPVAEFWGEFAGHEADTIVYMAGRNDVTKTERGVESSIVEHVLRANADVMEWATPRRKQVVLMGTITRTDEVPGSVGFEQVREIRHRLRLMYPEHFLDVQGYLLSQDVWADTGIDPTQADLDAQARGMTPPSLFDDVTHYSRATAKAVAEHLVAPFLVTKGWVVSTVPVPQAAGWVAPLATTHDTTLALRRDTTVGTLVYVGDMIVHGRTGWRDITSLITGTVTSGRLLLARTESAVWLHFDQLVMGAAGSGTIATLPAGWRPTITQGTTMQGVSSRVQVSNYGHVQIYNWETAPMVGTVTFLPDGTWPTTYPGTPI